MKRLKYIVAVLLTITSVTFVGTATYDIFDDTQDIHLNLIIRNHKVEKWQKAVFGLFIEGRRGRGTGIAIDDHFILTAYHVVRPVDNNTKIGLVKIFNRDGINIYNLRNKEDHIYKGRVILYDEALDVALVYFPDHVFKHTIKFQLDYLPKADSKIYHLGYPPSIGPLLSSGKVNTYRLRNGGMFLSADLNIIPGSSGGVIITEKGRYLAMSQKYSISSGNDGFCWGVTSHSIYIWLKEFGFDYLIDY